MSEDEKIEMFAQWTPEMKISPFMQALEQQGLEYKRLEDGKVNMDMVNLLITKRDLVMWRYCNSKPHRHWKVTDVKNYFGIQGNKVKLYEQFTIIWKTLMPKKSWDCEKHPEETSPVSQCRSCIRERRLSRETASE